MSIWQSGTVEWTAGDGQRLVQLFHRAFPEPADLSAAAQVAGVSLIEGPLSRSVVTVEAWLEAAVRAGRLLALAAVVLQDDRRSLFHAMLRDLLGPDLPAANVARIEVFGVPREQQALEALVTEETVAELDRHAGFEAINRPGAGLPDAMDEMRVLGDAMCRTALIRRNRNEVGTGFLVGPDLVLTAAHVLNLHVGDASPEEFEVVFGYVSGWRSPAERNRSEYVEEILDWSPPSKEEGPPFRNRTIPGRDDELDYVLLRLTRPVGLDPVEANFPRGWYELSTVTYQPQPGAGLAVVGHPLGLTLRRSWIADTPVWPPGNRVRYAANTFPGSSGGPVINRSGMLVALHHYQHSSGQAQAVPIWLIAETLSHGPYASELNKAVPLTVSAAPPLGPPANVMTHVTSPGALAGSGDDPFEVLEILGDPIINRKPLRKRLHDLACGDGTRTMVITGGTDGGISTSFVVLAHVVASRRKSAVLQNAAPGGMAAMKIDLVRFRITPASEQAEAIMAAIYREVTGEILEERVAQVARHIDTFERWARNTFADTTRQWWLFVDSINNLNEDLSPMTSELVGMLLDLSRDPLLGVRMVLAGQVANQIEHRAIYTASPDEAYGLQAQEVREWFQDWAKRQAIKLPGPTLDGVVSRLFPPAGRSGGLLALQLDVMNEQRKLRP